MRWIVFLSVLVEWGGLLAQGRNIHPMQKCIACHNGKTDAPFDWTNDTESFRNKTLIMEVINNATMPPWFTDTSFQKCQNELVLKDDEKKEIERFLNAEKTFPKNGNRDNKTTKQVTGEKITIAMNKAYVIPPHENDLFHFFQSNYCFSDTLRISRIGIYSANKKTLHHCEVFVAPKDSFVGKQYENSEKMIISDTAFAEENSNFTNYSRILAGRFSGITTFDFPKGFSMVTKPDERILYFAHYSPSPMEDKDSAWIELTVDNTLDSRTIKEFGIHANQTSSLLNPPFYIEKDSIKTFFCRKIIEDTLSVFSAYPHAHHLCQNFLAYAVTPEGDTINLIKIDKWQFHWQWHYNYENLKVIPKGSAIYTQATYDNTVNNIDNPFSPPRDVRLSFGANDEMMTLFLYYADYRKGDDGKALVWNQK